MKVSLSWLSDFVTLPASRVELEDVFTRAGLTVEAVEERGAAFPNVVVGRILESSPHPNADRLSVCRVDDGTAQPRQIVCGAKNYKVGDKVPLALPGAVLPGDFKIKTGKLRGVESEGMMCSAKELRLAEDAQGLLILPPDAPVGAPISEVFPADTVLDLEVTPNRPDWLGHLGVAREISALSGSPLRSPEIPVCPHGPGDAVRVEASDACPFYSVRRICGVKVAPSPDWLRRRLEAVGLRPINNIVDVTNYVMLELGQPLHAFDAARVDGPLVVRRAREGESLRALDGRDYRPASDALVIADSSGPLALAGVMGGESSGVGEATVDILLESAVFNPATIRRTARGLGLHSDSSYRFERGVDPAGVLSASSRATALILELAGGIADGTTLSAGVAEADRGKVSIHGDRCCMVLGAQIPDEEIAAALSAFGLMQDGNNLWQPPSWRPDLTREADLIEEVARFVGIGRIPSRLISSPAATGPADRTYDFAAELRRTLAGYGYSEARTGTLVSAAKATGASDALSLRNPLGEEQAFLRPSLVPSLLDAMHRNLNNGEKVVRLFEIGKVFHAGESEEELTLGLVASGPEALPGWRQKSDRDIDFFDVKGLLGDCLGIGFAPGEPDTLCALKARALHEGNPVGYLGQLLPSRARLLDAPGAVIAAEILLTPLVPAGRTARAVAPLPAFPASSRDVAIVAPVELPYSTIAATIHDANEPLLVNAAPFDVFHDPGGKHLPATSKSLAISLTFASPDRTLTAEEVNDATRRIKQRLVDKLGVAFRE